MPHTPNEPEAEKASVHRPRGPRWATLAASLWAAFQVAACDSPTEPDPGDDPDRIQIEAIEGLEPGEVAEVTGRNLDSIHALTLDGEPVTFEAISETRGQFTVPRTRDCEVDGRSVQLVANDSISHASRMAIADVLELEVAESRALSQEEFSCLKLGRGAEHYVLSVADLRTEPGHDRSPYELVVHGSGESPSTEIEMGRGRASLGTASVEAGGHTHSEGRAAEAPTAASHHHPGYGPSEGQFDDYANAEVGDTVRMVNWDDPDWRYAETKEDVPSYEAIVVALEGRQLVVVDTRDQEAVELLDDPEALEAISEAAKIVDEVIEPTLKTLFGPDFEIMDGAGGRMTTILKEMDVGGRPYMRDEDINSRRWASEMFTIQVDASLAHASPQTMARIMNHEFGHVADGVLHLDFGGHQPLLGSGFYGEAIAVTAEDVAARLARGGLRNAPSPAPSVSLSAGIERSPSISSDQFSPWGDPDGNRTRGWYTRGARILRYAQSTLEPGEEWRLQHALRERDMADDRSRRQKIYSIEAIAEEVGMTAKELIQESMLADITDGLVPSEVAQSQELPQVAGWERTDRENVERWIERFTFEPLSRWREATNLEVTLPPGGYAYRYIPGDTERGFSLEVTEQETSEEGHEVRITRLR